MSAAVAAEAGGHSSLHHHVLDVACNSGSFLMYDVCTDAAWPIMVRNRPQRLGTAGCISHPEEVWKSRTSFQLIEHGRKGGGRAIPTREEMSFVNPSMDAAINKAMDNALREGAVGVVCSDKNGLCLSAKGTATNKSAGLVSSITTKANRLTSDPQAVVVVETEYKWVTFLDSTCIRCGNLIATNYIPLIFTAADNRR
ncbi:hypothetical protein PROFUN_15147 [Planoprotostelium fungivorum]|uniref:Late endosomal/lysosomal adaptor and MAPK and MTOR activator 5 n=1 Tax=Planoprotostelium fungivorum TaxID=1890364 RepID=A0A2P6MXR0_9EUKA|nr:hypothetical protein PROFUN_15147 [Planoprotostelium fungivorum]